MTSSQDQKTLGELREAIKKLPINERKQAASLYTLFEEIVANKEQEEKDNDVAFKAYSESINKITTAMDQIIEGKRKVEAEELAYWKDKVDSSYVPDETANNGAPIKGFWRKFIENAKIYHGEQDLPILDHLTHIEIAEDTDKTDSTLSFTTLNLEFEANEFFKNTHLSVKLFTKDGELTKSEGTQIEWLKNVTVKKTSKTQKNKRTGQTRTITKETQLKSFFEMFGNFTTEDADDKDEHKHGKDEECDDSSMNIWELSGQLDQINDILPYALEYYLNVVQEDDEDDEDDIEGEEDNDSPDNSEDDDDRRPRYGKKKEGKESKGSKKTSRKASEAAEKKPDEKGDSKEQPKNPECKQQ